MQIIPKKGYLLLSVYEVQEEKKSILILNTESKKKGYMKVESSKADSYEAGDIVIINPFKSKIQVDDNTFLVDEQDVIATVVND